MYSMEISFVAQILNSTVNVEIKSIDMIVDASNRLDSMRICVILVADDGIIQLVSA